MPHERRRHVRKRVDLPAVFELNGENVEAHLSDMSPGGAFIDSEVVPPFGSELRLSIDVEGKAISIKGTVRWIKPGGFGVQFGILGAKETYAITEFLAGHEAIPDSRRF